MRGVFRTIQYASRRDYEQKRPSGVYVVQNSLLEPGVLSICEALLGGDDSLVNPKLRVGDGSGPIDTMASDLEGQSKATSEMDQGFPVHGKLSDDTYGITFESTFSEEFANFEWKERGILTTKDVLLDRAVEDQGRKAPGTIWVMTAFLDFKLGAEDG